MSVTADELRALFSYDQETGEFTRLSGRYAGRVVGSKTVRGIRQIWVIGKKHAAHRLAWLYMTGRWPEQEIDHIDGDPLNNRFSNLRESSSAQNKQNRHGPRRDNAAGLIGGWRERDAADGTPRWRAVVQVDGRRKSLGLFKTPDAAQAAYLSAKRELHPFNTL